MGLDATVRCACFERRRASAPPVPHESICVSEDGELRLDSRRNFDEETRNRFEAWQRAGCEHENMVFVSERIATWAGVSEFKLALSAVAGFTFPTLSSGLPDANGGTMSPATAEGALAELQRLRDVESIPMTALVDTDSDEVVVYSFGASGWLVRAVRKYPGRPRWKQPLREGRAERSLPLPRSASRASSRQPPTPGAPGRRDGDLREPGRSGVLHLADSRLRDARRAGTRRRPIRVTCTSNDGTRAPKSSSPSPNGSPSCSRRRFAPGTRSVGASGSRVGEGTAPLVRHPQPYRLESSGRPHAVVVDIERSRVAVERLVAVVDQGSTLTKGCVVDRSGARVLTLERRVARRSDGARVEQDPAELARSVEEVIAGLLRHPGVGSIGLTCQRSTCLVWERASGEPLTPRDRLAGPA